MGLAAAVMQRKMAALNAHDLDGVLECFSADALREVPGALLRGREQVRAFCGALLEAFPDFHLEVTQVVEQGNVIAIRGRATGTHLRTFHTPGGDIPATGQRVDVTLLDVYQVEGNVIVSAHLYFDRLALLEQLGVVPAPVPA